MVDPTIERYSTKGVPGRRCDSIPGGRERVTGTQLKLVGKIELNPEVHGDVFSVIESELSDYCEFTSAGDGIVRGGHPDKKWAGEFGDIGIEVEQSYTRTGDLSVAKAYVKYGSSANEADLDVVRRALTSSGLEKI